MSTFVAISDARAELPKIVSKVDKYLERVFITVRGRPKAVILSPEELESLEETAEVLAIPGARESIEQGLKEAKKGLGVPLSELK